jgi:tetratricopeptide (TPR) repeat protein
MASNLFDPTEALGRVECGKPEVYQKSQLIRCEAKNLKGVVPVASKKFFLLIQTGSAAENAYDQGYLLAPEITRGAIVDMVKKLKGFSEGVSPALKPLAKALVECKFSQTKPSLLDEVFNPSLALGKGYGKRLTEMGETVGYSPLDFQNVNAGIELGNIMYGLSYKQHEMPIKAYSEMLTDCGGKILKGYAAPVVAKLKEELYELFVTKSQGNEKFGCTGLVAPASATSHQSLIHGRNLDQSPQMETWNNAPVIYLIAEPGYHKFVAAGTAGLIFPAGISGFNEHGLSVSSHQMNTTRYDERHSKGKAEILPFLQQRILREAKSIDDAVALVKKTKLFSSWTILLSDASTNEVASIEVSAKRVSVARRVKDQVFAQSNHFLDPKMVKEQFHDRYGNWLETQSRFNLTNKALSEAKGKINLDWAINYLTTHADDFDPSQRFIGRAPVKPSNIMSTIAIPGLHEFWMTVGEIQPAAHSHFTGVRVNFEKLSFENLGLKRTTLYSDDRQSLEKAFYNYTQAFILYRRGEIKESYKLLLEAKDFAKSDGYDEQSIRYALGRVAYELGNFQEAYEHFSQVLAIHGAHLHAYTKALVLIHQMSTADALFYEKKVEVLPAEERLTYLNEASALIASLGEDHPGVRDLKHKKEMIKDLKKRVPLDTKISKKYKVQSFDFGLVD